MNPTIPYKKHSLSSKKQINSMLRKQARHHEKSNSMMGFLQIRGNDQQNDLSHRASHDSFSFKQQTVEQMVEKQFIALKQKVQIYCKHMNKFVQHQKIQNSIQQQDLWVQTSVSEQDIFSLFIGRISQFIGLSESNHVHTPKKKSFPSSYSHSLNVQSINLAGQTKELQKIENIEVLEVYNNSRNHSKCTDNDIAFPKPSVSHAFLTGQNTYSSNFISSLPIACSSTVSEVLYKEAHLRSFPEFHKFCEKILLDKKPVISDFHFFKKQKLEKTNFYLSQICRKINLLNTKLSLTATGDMNFIKKQNFTDEKDKGKNIGHQIDEICMVLKKLNQLHNLNSLVFDCMRPCCKSQEAPQTTSTKAKILLNLKQSAKKSLHYNTEITEEYFNRYYRNESFDRTRIYSLAKTKTEQMERLEKTYHRMKSNKKACRQRCHSLFENIC